jgi:hypothetical protein
MVEVRLPLHLSVEADALYRSLTYSSHISSQIPKIDRTDSSDSRTWEVPILAKYRFSFPVFAPYLDAGPSFRSPGGSLLSNHGVTFGAGVDVKAPVVHISPEFRYTRWAGDTQVSGLFVAPSKQDQVEFLVGVSF